MQVALYNVVSNVSIDFAFMPATEGLFNPMLILILWEIMKIISNKIIFLSWVDILFTLFDMHEFYMRKQEFLI